MDIFSSHRGTHHTGEGDTEFSPTISKHVLMTAPFIGKLSSALSECSTCLMDIEETLIFLLNFPKHLPSLLKCLKERCHWIPVCFDSMSTMLNLLTGVIFKLKHQKHFKRNQ
jgi:hypothetical protein